MSRFTRLFRNIIKINVRERKQKRNTTNGKRRNLSSFSWILNLLFTHGGKNGFIPVAASANSRYFSIFPYFFFLFFSISSGVCFHTSSFFLPFRWSSARLLSSSLAHFFGPSQSGTQLRKYKSYHAVLASTGLELTGESLHHRGTQRLCVLMKWEWQSSSGMNPQVETFRKMYFAGAQNRKVSFFSFLLFILPF